MDNSKASQNKWLYAFIAVAVALVAAIVVIIVMGVSSTPDVPDGTTPGEGAETGVYYYDVESGEVILSLNSGNKFTIASTELNKSGTYTVDGQNLTLDFLRDEDGTASAVLGENTVTVTYGDNSVMTFLKKVNYTVSFNTNGGSTTDSVTVINGKPVVKPADPTKDGSVFLGWYADAALTSIYDFGTAVTADVTVYAYWAEKTVGQPEYNATLNLGYEGAEDAAEIETIGGKLYKLPTPEREGYTFTGWYVSDYEDGAKLTYQYVDGMVLTANTTLFATWKDNTDTKLPAPGVSVSGNTVKWNSVEGASTYSIVIKDSDGNILLSETLGSTTKTYNFSERAAGDYTVEVTAVAPNPNNNSAPAVRSYKNKALNRVSLFQVVNGVLIFSPVENAERYFVTVDCGNPQHEHTMLNNSTSTVFDFNGCTMQPGGIKFTVTAAAAGYASSVSQTFVYDKTLPAIGTVVYNESTDSFVWDAVANASGYKVEVVCGDKTTVFTVPTTYFSLASFSGNVTVKVSPVCDGYNSPAATIAAFNKLAPAAPTNLKINGMVISWDDNGSTSYVVRIGNKQFDTNTNSIDLSGKALALNEGDECVIKVVAIKDGKLSAESSITAKYLDMSDAISYNNNTVTWPAIIGSSKFEVRVNGGKAITVIGENSAKVTLTQAGKNVIEVRCADTPGATWYSVEVFAYTVTYNSRSLSGIVTEYVANGDALTMPQTFTNAGYTFSGWYTTPNAATGNGKEYTSGTLNSIGDMILYANWSPNEYKFNFNVSDNVDVVAPQWPVTYMKDFTLPVPVSTGEQEGYYFLGWFTAPAGTGEKITDEFGQSVAPYKVIGDMTLYPYFAAALTFVREEDGKSYGVRQGPGLVNKSVVNIVIPAEYNGLPVTRIRDNAFYYCENIETIMIPDTVTKIGVGAFEVCRSLKSVEVYATEHEEGELYEPIYSSHDGALIYYNETSDTTYLEFFPRAKVGTYTVPSVVDSIRPYAFKYSTVEKVIIGAGVTNVGDAAFYKCSKLSAIEFEFDREEPVTIHKTAFQGLTKLTSLVFPAALNEIEEMKALLDSLPSLLTIDVEEGGEFYSSKHGLLCDGLGIELLYVPVTYKGNNGVFEAPDGIMSIGAGVFEGKTAITEVIVPEYLNNIGLNAFKDCTEITKVTVKGPRSTSLTIGDESFIGCTALTEIKFIGAAQANSRGAITVGTKAFEGCVNLDTLNIGEKVNVAKLGDFAFNGASALEDIIVADSATLTEIGQNTFQGCVRLRSFTIHKTTTAIGNGAFTGCSFLNTVEFAEGGGDINFGSYVFKDCERLTKVKLPATLTSFDGSAFDGCDRITEIEVDPANKALAVLDGVLYTKDFSELLYFPRNLEVDFTKLPWDKLTKLGASAFKNNSKVKSVVIGAKITELGDGAFENCINLESVTFAKADGAMIIGDRAFMNCAMLTNITLPTNTTKIGDSAFYMTALEAITVPATVTEVGSYAFSYTNITSIELPAALEKLGTGAFNMAKNLTTVIFNEGANDLVIGDLEAYTAEHPMPEVPDPKKTWPASYYGPMYSIFYGTKVASLELPANLTVVDDYAFYGATSLTSLTTPENVRLQTIGDHAFAKTAFPSINLGNTITAIGPYAFAYSKLTSASIPASVDHIYEFAFAAKTFTSITFANGVAGDTLELHHAALAGANLTGTIVLPSHMVQIGKNELAMNGDYVLGVFYDHKSSSSLAYTEIDYAERNSLGANASLKAIEVNENNTRYASKDGVLYARFSVDGSLATLLLCPRANAGDENGVITVPKTVTYVQHGAFNKITSVKKIIFEEFDKEDTEHYGKPLLTLGAYVGTAYEAANDPAKVIFSSGSTSMLEEISFPSHLAIVYSRALVGVKNTTGTKQLTVNFNPDSLVEFEQASLRGNSGITTLNLPKLKRVALQAFYQSSGVTSIFIAEGSTATELGNRAFESCSKLTTITIPESIEMIGEACFRQCSKLTEIIFATDENGKSGVTSIGNECFNGCGFTSFEIPEGVTVLGYSVFKNCRSLLTISIPATLENVVPSSSSLIDGCTTITDVFVSEDHPYLMSENGILYDKDKTALYIYPSTKGGNYQIPDTITTIEGGALARFPGNTITLPEGLLTIKNNAFANSKLTSIVIPASVQSIGSNAFYESALTSLVFDNIKASKLEMIGAYSFYGTDITELILPDNVAVIGQQAFLSCGSLKTVVLSAALTELGDQAFRYCGVLESITMQEGLKMVGNSAFNYCYELKSVTFPDSVSSIGNMLFSECSKLETVIFTENSKLASMGYAVFYKCVALKKATIGPLVEEFPVTSFANSPFTGCTNLEEVVLPAKLSVLNDDAFKGCAKLTTVVMPTALTKIGNNAFNGCASLESAFIAATVSSIGENAFAGCASLESVTFEDGCAIKVISDGAFEGTVSLTDVRIPATVTEFGARAFKNSALSTTPIGENVTKIGDEAFYGCTNIVTLNIPTGVKNLGANTFYGCTSLKTLTLTDGLRNIGDFAFANCTSLTSVTIPETVTGITANPFMGCTGLESMTVLSRDFTYDAENGVLFDKEQTMILFYAPFNDNDTYTIPDMVEVMGGAFANSQLKSIVLPQSTKKIPAAAFQNSKYLESVVIPASVTAIDKDAFNGCAKLDNVVIPASVESLGDSAFAGCSSLASFTLAERKTDITVGERLFEGCASLTAITEFPGVTEFTPYMYAGTGIVDLVIPESITHLSTEGVFMNCVNLKTVDFGYNISGDLGDRLFKGCTSLENVSTPESVYSLGGWNIGETFMNCTSLKTVSTYANNICISNFENCTNLTTVTFNVDQWTMISVEARAFKNCTKLASMDMFNQIYRVGEESFMNCTSLVGDITFGNELDLYSSAYAFSGCTGIGQISIARPGSVDINAFTGLTSNTTIYLRNYKNVDEMAADWNDTEWMQYTDATIKFYAPPATGVTLTAEEIDRIETICMKMGIKDVELVKSKCLEFKSGYTTLFPAKELTKEEQAGIFTFCETVGIKESDRIMQEFLDYKLNLSKNMLNTAFDAHEQEMFQICKDKFGLPAESNEAFQQALFDYKMAYEERNPGNELSKEEQAALQDFMKEMGFKDEGGALFDTFMKNFIEYKKYLTSKLPIEITHVITDAEQRAIDTLYKDGKIGKEHVELFQTALLEFKASFASLGLTEGEPSKEEMQMLYSFLEENGIKPTLADEWIKSGAYVTFKQKLIARTTISDAETKKLDEWEKAGWITPESRAKLEEHILAYKASFNMTEAPKPESSELQLVTALCNDLGLAKEARQECVKGFATYREELVKTIM